MPGKTLILLLALAACGETQAARDAEWMAAGELLTLGFLGVASGASRQSSTMTTCYVSRGLAQCYEQ